jgi:phosphohistidine phosphatase SixA
MRRGWAILCASRLIPDVMISSDAMRARMTAEALPEATGYTRDILYLIVISIWLYLASPDDIIAVLRTMPSAHVGSA